MFFLKLLIEIKGYIMEKDFKFLFKIGRGAFGKVWKV